MSNPDKIVIEVQPTLRVVANQVGQELDVSSMPAMELMSAQVEGVLLAKREILCKRKGSDEEMPLSLEFGVIDKRLLDPEDKPGDEGTIVLAMPELVCNDPMAGITAGRVGSCVETEKDRVEACKQAARMALEHLFASHTDLTNPDGSPFDVDTVIESLNLSELS